ncbi:MAG TPA: BMC domain-containing protein [Thermoanaerobaculaceae bacterium]|nr:BMC domain-containing protein [Thermoanaerobaculaceae bacterium]HRS15807.1 BMC domain-containing protein [Thermoanaerobaculaceae bacterium]
MKPVAAIAVVDFREIPAGIAATDAMVKCAPIALVRSGSVTGGRFLTLVGGSPAAVEEAVKAGLEAGGEAVLDHVLLADVHPHLLAGIQGARQAPRGALGVLETDTAAAAVRAAERALKGAHVELSEIRLADTGLAGKGLAVLAGELHDVEAAVELAAAELASRGLGLRVRVIAGPHGATLARLASATRFDSAPLLELGGEVG